MSEIEENERICRRGLDELFERGDFGALDELIHPDFVNHEAPGRTWGSDLACSSPIRGLCASPCASEASRAGRLPKVRCQDGLNLLDRGGPAPEKVEPEAEPRCLGYRPLLDPRRDGAMVIVEEWVDEAALDYHFTTPHFERVAAALEDILAEPFTLTRLTPRREQESAPSASR